MGLGDFPRKLKPFCELIHRYWCFSKQKCARC